MSLMMKYFVLKPRGKDKFAAASRRAMLAYANWIEAHAETDEEKAMAKQMIDWVEVEWLDAHEENFTRIYHASAERSA